MEKCPLCKKSNVASPDDILCFDCYEETIHLSPNEIHDLIWAENLSEDKSFTAHDDAISDGCVMCGNEWISLNKAGYCSSCWTIWNS